MHDWINKKCGTLKKMILEMILSLNNRHAIKIANEGNFNRIWSIPVLLLIDIRIIFIIELAIDYFLTLLQIIHINLIAEGMMEDVVGIHQAW